MVKSKTKIKEKLWKYFSLYIRLRDTDNKGMWKCISCWREYHYKTLQCWHFIPRYYHIRTYDEKINNANCYWCNCMKSWNYIEYEYWMIKKYWKKEVERLKNWRNELKNRKEYELEEMIEIYKNKSDELLKTKK